MNVLLYLPASMRRLCFRDCDLDRLRAQHRVVIPDLEDKAELQGVWRDEAGETAALITGWDTPAVTDEQLDAAPALRLIVHAAGSIRGLIPESVWARGIRVGTCNGALAIGVAETTLGCIIAGVKGLFNCDRVTREGGWKRGPFEIPGFPSRDLFGLTVGIVGAGRVGRCVAERLRGFELEVLFTDPFLGAEDARAMGGELVALEDLLRRSDVITLHAPQLPATRHMLAAPQFRMMKDDAILINTARGSLIDESALIPELQRGRFFAILDVTDPEPPAPEHPFRALPNCVLTPHIAGAVAAGRFRQGRSAVDQLLEFAAGRTMHGEVTAEAAARMA